MSECRLAERGGGGGATSPASCAAAKRSRTQLEVNGRKDWRLAAAGPPRLSAGHMQAQCQPPAPVARPVAGRTAAAAPSA